MSKQIPGVLYKITNTIGETVHRQSIACSDKGYIIIILHKLSMRQINIRKLCYLATVIIPNCQSKMKEKTSKS